MKQTNTQTRNPSSLAMESLDRENFHYVKVQNADYQGWETPIEDYLDKPSPTDPSKPMYEVASTDRKFTGSSKMTLLRCAKEDAEAMLAANAAQANYVQQDVKPDTGDSFESLTRSGSVSF